MPTLEYMRAWKEAHRDELRAYYRAYRKAHPEHRAAYVERHPDRVHARQVLNDAVAAGTLERLPCEVCGGAAEAHHTNYEKPLDVRWLCRVHHMEEHYDKSNCA